MSHMLSRYISGIFFLLCSSTMMFMFAEASTALARASLFRRSWRRSWEGDFFFLGIGWEGGGGWWGGWWGKWGWSGWPNTADRCMWRLPYPQDKSSLAFSPCFQCLASGQKLATATSRLEMLDSCVSYELQFTGSNHDQGYIWKVFVLTFLWWQE